MSGDGATQVTSAPASAGFQPLNWKRAGLLALVGIACFHAAYTPARSGWLAFAIVGYLLCLVQLARLRTTRQCFYTGVAVGFACFAPQLDCFWRIFGAAAIALWLVLAFWMGLFLAVSHLALARLGLTRGALLIPFLWTGLEYFRSELYYLKFSWLNVGYAFAQHWLVPFPLLGMYGLGFVVVLAVVLMARLRREHLRRINLLLVILVIIAIGIVFACFLPAMGKMKRDVPSIVVVGVQMEFPNEKETLRTLDAVLRKHPQLAQSNLFYQRHTSLDLVVLPEYTLDGEPTPALKDWCRNNNKFLIVGGKDHSPGTNYFNTAFVINTNGEVVFQQVKSVPIQFFKDGLPATEQKVWDSPWGKIGICICYDLSYTRVTDELVRQGAQMLIVPTMDVADWGRHQHELHARVAPVRAAEYGIPIFRVASSGISQGVDWRGLVKSSAPFEGEGETLFFGANLNANRRGSLPLDRWLAPFCVVVTGAFVVWLAAESFLKRRKNA